MADHRTKAKNTVNYLRIAPHSQRLLREERTLNVEVPKEASMWPVTYCAQLSLRVALENGCTKVRVLKGQHVRAEYDVMDLVTLSRRMSASGRYLAAPTMKRVPANLATMGHARLGNRLETQRLVIPVRYVPNQPLVSATDGVNTHVSGTAAG